MGGARGGGPRCGMDVAPVAEDADVDSTGRTGGFASACARRLEDEAAVRRLAVDLDVVRLEEDALDGGGRTGMIAGGGIAFEDCVTGSRLEDEDEDVKGFAECDVVRGSFPFDWDEEDCASVSFAREAVELCKEDEVDFARLFPLVVVIFRVFFIVGVSGAAKLEDVELMECKSRSCNTPVNSGR